MYRSIVVASIDVLATGPLGEVSLSVAEVAQSHRLVYQHLKALHIPTVHLGGGGHDKDSAAAIVTEIRAVVNNHCHGFHEKE